MMHIRVFMADDHTVIYDGLKSVMEEQGNIEVIGYADNGRDAVNMIRQLAPDIVIMDIGMPQLNGIEATRQIVQENPNARVIILSMHLTTEHIYQALKAGAVGYLVKESAGRDVVEAIQVVAEGKRYLSQQVSGVLMNDYMRMRDTVVESPLDRLTAREREVLQLVVEGKSSASIAETLSLSPSTVDTYRSRIMTKLGVHSLPELIKFALQNGLTTF